GAGRGGKGGGGEHRGRGAGRSVGGGGPVAVRCAGRAPRLGRSGVPSPAPGGRRHAGRRERCGGGGRGSGQSRERPTPRQRGRRPRPAATADSRWWRAGGGVAAGVQRRWAGGGARGGTRGGLPGGGAAPPFSRGFGEFFFIRFVARRFTGWGNASGGQGTTRAGFEVDLTSCRSDSPAHGFSRAGDFEEKATRWTIRRAGGWIILPRCASVSSSSPAPG